MTCVAGCHAACDGSGSSSRYSSSARSCHRPIFNLLCPASRYGRVGRRHAGNRLCCRLLCVRYGCMVFHSHPVLLHLPRRWRHDRADLTGLPGTVCLCCAVCMSVGFRRGISAGKVLQRLFRRSRYMLRRDRGNHMAGLPICSARRRYRRQLAVGCFRRAHAAEIRR